MPIKEDIKFVLEHNKAWLITLWVVVKAISLLIFIELNCNEIKDEWPKPLEQQQEVLDTLQNYGQ